MGRSGSPEEPHRDRLFRLDSKEQRERAPMSRRYETTHYPTVNLARGSSYERHYRSPNHGHHRRDRPRHHRERWNYRRSRSPEPYYRYRDSCPIRRRTSFSKY